jgi:hypothetical protein
MSALPGIKSLLIDPTFASPTVPAGAWSLNEVELYGLISPALAFTTLTFADGATLVNTSQLILDNIVLASVSTSPVMTLAGGNGAFIQLILSTIIASAAAPFFLATGAGGLALFCTGGGTSLGDGSNPIAEVDDAATVFIALSDNSFLAANATTGTGAGTIELQPSGFGTATNPTDCNLAPPQIANLTIENLLPSVFPIGQQAFENILTNTGPGVEGVASRQTPNNVPTNIDSLDQDLSLGTVATPLPNHSSGTVELRVVARKPATGETVTWHAEAPFKNSGGISVGPLTNVGGAALAFAAPTAGDAAAFAGATIGIAITANGIVPQVTGLGVVIDWTVKATYFYVVSS